MLVNQRTANPDQMHDRENPGSPVPVLRGRHRITEQPAHIRMAALDERGWARRDEAVDLAGVEQAGNGCSIGRIVEAYAGRQLHGDFLRTTRLLDAAADPMDVGGL